MSVITALEEYREVSRPRVEAVIDAVTGRVSSLDHRWAQVPGDSSARRDLDALAVLAKDDLPALQRDDPPLGGLLPDRARAVRLFASPGPIYEAQLSGTDPWGWRPALTACGIGEGDVVLNCFSYHLSPAGAMFDEACRAVGATVVPGGVGMVDVQAQVVADLGVTAYVGLPSYLAALADKYDELGLAASSWRLSKALVTAEPLPETLRTSLRRRIDTVLMAYGTAEVGLIGHETSAGSGLCLNDRVYVQICDPVTGAPLADDGSGEVVASVVSEDYPLVRFGTGDVSRWQLGEDGSLRLAGVLGRVGAAVKVRGMFIHPHQAGEVLGVLRARGARAGRFTVDRVAGRDELTLELVAADAPDGSAETWAAGAERETQARLRVRPTVRLVEEVPEGEAVLVDRR